MGKPFVQQRGKGKSALALHCQTCFNPIEARVVKTGKPPYKACMRFDMPKEPKGRATIKQRGQYYGWHLVAKPNLHLNNIPIAQQSFFQKLFFGKVAPTKVQAKKYLNLISMDGGKNRNALRVAVMRVDRLLGDIQIFRTQMKQGEYTPKTQEIFEQSVETFEQNLKGLKKNLIGFTN